MHGVLIEEVSRRSMADGFESPRKVYPDTLKLAVINAADSGASGVVLEITPKGLRDSLRKKPDGQVFIGKTRCDETG